MIHVEIKILNNKDNFHREKRLLLKIRAKHFLVDQIYLELL